MLISERIFEILQQKEITQKEFAMRTGISQSTISDWKTKKTNPASDKIMLICDVLAITPYELLSGVENANYTQMDYVIVDKQTDDYHFLDMFRQLGTEERNRLFGYMQALSENAMH